MSLGSKQEEFARLLPYLLLQANVLGYKVRLKHLLRCRDCKVGHTRSLHKDSLAIDLVLFKDSKYLTDTEDYKELGEYWESIGGTWGGRFRDGGHFSLAHNGMK